MAAEGWPSEQSGLPAALWPGGQAWRRALPPDARCGFDVRLSDFAHTRRPGKRSKHVYRTDFRIGTIVPLCVGWPLQYVCKPVDPRKLGVPSRDWRRGPPIGREA